MTDFTNIIQYRTICWMVLVEIPLGVGLLARNTWNKLRVHAPI